MVKIATVLDEEPEIAEPARPRELPRIDGRSRHRPRRVRVRQGAGAARHRHPRAGGRLPRARRRVGRRQVDARAARRPLLRPRPGRGARRRRRPPRGRRCARTGGSSASCSRIRSCSAARSRRTSASRKPDATDEEVEAAAAAVGVDRVAARLSRRPRPRGARGRLGPVGRRAPADLDRTRAARRPAHPHPRRGDVEHRPADRGADRARARPAAARPDVDHHRAPPLDRPPRRRDRRRRARPDRPARHRARAARRRTGRSAGSPTTSTGGDRRALRTPAEALLRSSRRRVTSSADRSTTPPGRTASRRPRSSRRSASAFGSRLRYGRSVVIAWYASQTRMIRDSIGMSSPALPVGIAGAVVALVTVTHDRADLLRAGRSAR